MVAFGICNAMLTLMGQFVKEIYDSFSSWKKELIEHQRKCKTGEIKADTVFEFQADLRTIQMPLVPIDVLRTQASSLSPRRIAVRQRTAE